MSPLSETQAEEAVHPQTCSFPNRGKGIFGALCIANIMLWPGIDTSFMFITHWSELVTWDIKRENGIIQK